MKLHFLPVALIASCVTLVTSAAEPTDADAQSDAKKKEEIRALIVADSQNKPTKPLVTAPKVAVAEGPAAETAAAADSTTGTPQPPKEATTMLPQVEVNKSRITNLDIQISEQQRAIDREKQKTKPTKLDSTLNDPKLSKALSIFGGSSADDRSNLAKERVSLLEEEKEVLESMKSAQTKEEKAELQKELDILRATRRELEQAPK